MTILERLKFRLENHMAIDRSLGYEVLKEMTRLTRTKKGKHAKAKTNAKRSRRIVVSRG